MKIVVLDGFTLNPGDLSWDGIKELGDTVVYDRTPAEKAIERIGDAGIVITNKTVIGRTVLESCPAIRYVGVLATGYNVVDVETARERGIVVTNIPTYGTSAVGQFAIALLLEICHHIGLHGQSVKAGDWTKSPDFCYWKRPLIELDGKTMGIIGFGHIGRKTGLVAQALGMRILAGGSRRVEAFESETVKYVEMDELFAKSDVISLHCPLSEKTRGIINRNSIARMKDGVIIINTSRGGLIVEEDLAKALNKGKVYAAGLDVVSIEPVRADNPLLSANNCIITPHIAWAPVETRARLLNIAVDNLRSFLAGAPVNVVNG
ncbi:MAG: D-2-hydroxyacid dehydrogenase [Desulfuromonadales bacterium]|nr:D-2-hydroxyacid dehydrogenase [Desulfuromonadales bacterium]